MDYEIIAGIAVPLIYLIIFFAALIFFWEKIFDAFSLARYKNLQRVHDNEVPRLGGLFIYLSLWMILFLDPNVNSLFKNILISSIPIFLIGLKEDIFHNTSPFQRLFFITLSCLFFFFLNPIEFPKIDIPIISNLLSIRPVEIIFFVFSILIVSNGSNFIDGMNGLLPLTIISQLISILFLSSIFADKEVEKIIYLLGFPLIVFFLFNYPFGKIFIGDLGAYCYGFFVSLLVITFFGRNNDLLSWNAVLILVYPSFEVLFSVFRKKNPFDADNLHLHTLFFKLINKKFNNRLLSNNLTTFVMSIFFMAPISIVFIYNSVFNLLIVLILYVLLYLVTYNILLRMTNESN